jgi:hypothetical protein
MIWKVITEFEGLYEISDCGIVRNPRTNHWLKCRPDSDGYRIVTLWKGAPTKAYTLGTIVLQFIFASRASKDTIMTALGSMHNGPTFAIFPQQRRPLDKLPRQHGVS